MLVRRMQEFSLSLPRGLAPSDTLSLSPSVRVSGLYCGEEGAGGRAVPLLFFPFMICLVHVDRATLRIPLASSCLVLVPLYFLSCFHLFLLLPGLGRTAAGWLF